MNITRVGHACVTLTGEKNIMIDPFITDNPSAKLNLDQIPKLDYIVCTHDHFDHFNQDVITLAKRDDAKLVAVHELTIKDEVSSSGIETIGMNIGGTYQDDKLSISLTPAVHSAGAGDPSGVVVNQNNTIIYHAGDSAVFSDMKLIPELFGAIDVAFLPIGGHYTMDEPAAAKAVELLNPKLTVPIHYDTWPPISADTGKFIELCKKHKVQIIEPGGSINL